MAIAGLAFAVVAALPVFAAPTALFEHHCYECHDSGEKKGGLDLSKLPVELEKPENFARWLKVYERIEAGEMPPKGKDRPPAVEVSAAKKWLSESLVAADRKRLEQEGRTRVRRLTKAEYENTLRDLFDMPGIRVQENLPADGTAHGFDKNSDALDISHVNLAKYVEAADYVLDLAIATQPQPPKTQKQRISLACPGSGVAHVMLYGEAVMLQNKKPHPDFPPAGVTPHLDQGAHEQMKMYRIPGTVGLFRHEDESFSPYFLDFATLYPGRYRIRTSVWSFQWDKGEVLPSRGIEAVRLSVVQLTNDGRHTGHPSYVLGYFDAPSLKETEHEVVQWLNYKETIGFNAATLRPGTGTRGKNHVMGFTGPGVACDWLDIEGPIHDVWPPRGHQTLFGDLPLVEFKSDQNAGVRGPVRKPLRQEIVHVLNRPDATTGVWTVESKAPLADADRLLAKFLPRAFRRPVPDDVRKAYVAKVEERLKAGDCFELAMRWAYRAALCSPDFLFHVEPAGKLDGPAVACRLSYMLWNSQPDERLTQLAAEGKLASPDILRGEVERMLADGKSQRFVEDFLGQWLKLRQIAATDPDRKLYPEFNAYLQDSMVAETRAYFRELLDKDLSATHLVKSDFGMLNEKLADFYGIKDVKGTQMRRVGLPADCPRGPFLTHGAMLKITANGTTTSPVPRGAFVMARLLGTPPEPPPANVPAIEPDVRGAVTIREQLAKHRSDAACAACHAKMDPPGFALESFDVIGGLRSKYRILPAGKNAYEQGPAVDSSGELADGRAFKDILEFQALIAAEPARLTRNMVQQLAIYSTGRDLAFSDRDQVEAIVERTQKKNGGLRTLIHELVQSELFQTK